MLSIDTILQLDIFTINWGEGGGGGGEQSGMSVQMHDQKNVYKGCSFARDTFRGPKSPYFRN